MDLIIFLAIMAGLVVAYLAYFIYGRVRVWKKGLDNKPSWIGLMFFLFIIGLITAMGIPNFLKFNAKAKNSEAKTNLGAIYVAQLSYFSNANTYAGGPHVFTLINWEPAGQNRYAYYCQGAWIPNKLPAGGARVPEPGDIWPYEIKPESSKTGFTCMAVGNIDNDDTADVWTINDAKILRNLVNDR